MRYQTLNTLNTLNILTEHGCTSLHIASENGNCAAVEELMLHGASLATRNNEGKTPIARA